MNYFKQKIFFGKGAYILLAEFLILTTLTVKYYLLHQLSVDDGKPFFNFMLAVIGITGGCICMKRMQDWGGYKTILGKVQLFYGLGLFAWAAGTIIWAYYYLYLGVAMPYPSWADLAYVFINPCFIIGLVLLGYITAINTTQNQAKEKFFFFFIPACMALVTFYFTFILGHGSVVNTDSGLKFFLDIYYPGGDIVQLVLLVLVGGTTFNYLGERLRLPFILIITSVLISYLVDSLYAYTTSVGIYANGDITDFLYVIMLFLLSLGLFALHPKLLEDKPTPHS